MAKAAVPDKPARKKTAERLGGETVKRLTDRLS
jgi:hypothetical protein